MQNADFAHTSGQGNDIRKYPISEGADHSRFYPTNVFYKMSGKKIKKQLNGTALFFI